MIQVDPRWWLPGWAALAGVLPPVLEDSIWEDLERQRLQAQARRYGFQVDGTESTQALRGLVWGYLGGILTP